VIANSEGLYLRDELPLLFFIVQTMSEDGNARHMSRERISKHSGFEMFEMITPEEVSRRAAREAIAMLDAEDGPAGIMDVVIQNGWGGVLVHEAVGHPLEADNIAKGIGAFTGKVGQKVASDVFTMVDDGTIANGRGTINFDDEGTQAQKNVLIENGVLKGYMTDILSAKQLGIQRTGNGRRESFRYIPIPRMTNTFIDKGESDPGDILASTNKGIYVQSLSGGSVNPVTGVFNFTCREAYIIENGQKKQAIKGATLIGSCLDVISNIESKRVGLRLTRQESSTQSLLAESLKISSIEVQTTYIFKYQDELKATFHLSYPHPGDADQHIHSRDHWVQNIPYPPRFRSSQSGQQYPEAPAPLGSEHTSP